MHRDTLKKLAVMVSITLTMQAFGQDSKAVSATKTADTSSVKAQSEPATKVDDAPLGPDGMPRPKVELDKHGKPRKKKEKPPKLVPLSIFNGILTVDGITAKASLNYDIPDLHFLYIWAPGIGTVVISNKPFPWAKEQPQAFTQNTIDVMVQDHQLEIYSDKPLFDKKHSKEMVRNIDKKLVSAWVRVDPEFRLESPYAAMGYGVKADAPYAWPGSKPVEKRLRGVVIPPPMPSALRPVLVGDKPVGSAAPTPGVGQGPPTAR